MSGSFILETQELANEFRGFIAVQGVGLKVYRCQPPLIGPNGASKTVRFKLLAKNPSRPAARSSSRDATSLRCHQPMWRNSDPSAHFR